MPLMKLCLLHDMILFGVDHETIHRPLYRNSLRILCIWRTFHTNLVRSPCIFYLPISFYSFKVTFPEQGYSIFPSLLLPSIQSPAKFQSHHPFSFFLLPSRLPPSTTFLPFFCNFSQSFHQLYMISPVLCFSYK